MNTATAPDARRIAQDTLAEARAHAAAWSDYFEGRGVDEPEELEALAIAERRVFEIVLGFGGPNVSIEIDAVSGCWTPESWIVDAGRVLTSWGPTGEQWDLTREEALEIATAYGLEVIG